jgi:CheY-like chemotaxis protein
LNLTINARDSMPDGGTLTVSTADVPAGKPVPGFPRAETASADRIMLSVKDTGTGMDAETLRRCLEPFFTTKPVGKGAGLGLSMAYGFAEQSGGRLLIRSEPGQGTEVAMLFPCSSQPVLAMPTVNPASRPLGGHEQILVVEDDDGVRDHAARVLGDLGYRVTPVETADAAISYLRAGGTADLILSDIMMPGVADVRKLEAEARALLPEIQILYSSGYPKELIQADGRLAPDIELLPKPYRRSELALKVREMLDRTYARPGAATQDAD